MAHAAMDDSLPLDDPIAALASAPGPAPRGIVRFSGENVHPVLSDLFCPDDAAAWRSPRRAARHPGTMRLPGLHLPLRVDVLLWPTKRTYTGQPLAEFHTIGSPPLLEGILSALFDRGVRPARRGEFTLRAFLAGRIDLLQAEAVLGVIDATDQQQLSVALGQLGGGLSNRIAELHEELLLHLADLEAGLDFVEEDIDFVSREELARRLDEGEAFVSQLIDRSQRRLHSTGRLRVVLAGLPNAGKSTLFNALVGDPRAIVSHIAGTTRDYLAAPLNWDGLSIELIDTAGWDRLGAGIAQAADDLRQQQWEQSDLVVWCSARDMTAEQQREDLALRETFREPHAPLVVTTKGDCGSSMAAPPSLVVAAARGDGLAELRRAIRERLESAAAESGVLGSTAARCQESLQGAARSLRQARQCAAAGLGDELIALELREAIDHLGKIAGRVYTDDILDRIFSRFCIGK